MTICFRGCSHGSPQHCVQLNSPGSFIRRLSFYPRSSFMTYNRAAAPPFPDSEFLVQPSPLFNRRSQTSEISLFSLGEPARFFFFLSFLDLVLIDNYPRFSVRGFLWELPGEPSAAPVLLPRALSCRDIRHLRSDFFFQFKVRFCGHCG